MIRKIALAVLSALSIGGVVNAQYVGKWQAELDVAGTKLPLVVRIADGKHAWMDSPKQMAMNIVCDTLSITDNHVAVGVKRMGILIDGLVGDDGNMSGTFHQGLAQLPIELSFVDKNPYLTRPQTPQPPYTYEQREVKFSHGDVTLTGTLTMPEKGKNFTAVILVSGSGQQNRDEEIMGHRPFLVLADYLTRHGIAVLRYDDRGVGGSSPCSPDATTRDFADDALAAVKYLRTVDGINKKKVGIIGHSEGGQIAIMLAAENPKDVDFIATLAAPTVKGKDMLVQQNIDVAASNGVTLGKEKIERLEKAYSTIDTVADVDVMKSRIYNILTEGASVQEMMEINSQIMVITTPWFINFVRYNPAEHIEMLRQPIFALYGKHDVQVNAEANAAVLSACYGGKRLTLKNYDTLNHMFQQCDAPTANYGSIEQTLSPEMMADMLKWLQER